MSSYMNYSELQPLTMIPSLSTMIQDNTNPNVNKLIEIKETVLDIINNNEEITIEETFENTEIKELITKIQGLTPTFQKIQDELSEIDKQYKDEIKDIKKKVESIDSMISFLRQISYSTIEETEIKPIVDQMKQISEKIINNETITKLRESYINKRKELYPHLCLMKQLNQWNTANMCPICFKNPVSHFMNPCGHTGCKECLDKNRRIMNQGQLPQSELSFECAFCRTQISSMKPLFFL